MKNSNINSNLLTSSAPPIEEMLALYEKNRNSLDLPLLDLSQAAPSAAPPKSLQRAIIESLRKPENHRYGAILGKIELREAITKRWNELYKSNIFYTEVGVTAGCNQAFCASVNSVASAGDSVMVPFPCYFNHKMWLDMQGINIIELPCSKDLLPDIKVARGLFSQSVKAIVLVTPNNPTGKEYPDKLLQEFADLVKEKNISLILDETYRDFISDPCLHHTLLQRADWRDWLIHLYSFSKAYRITGHRIGAFVTNSYRTKQIEKFLDATTICPNQLGQEAALHGLKHLSKFLERERLTIIQRKNTLSVAMKGLPEWKILSSGAFFAYVKYPMNISSVKFSELLLKEVSLLVVPGSMFESKTSMKLHRDQTFRLAFANVKKINLEAVVDRFKTFEGLFYEKYCVQPESSLER